MTYEFSPESYELLLRTKRQGRAHDVTLFIQEKGRIAVIRKPGYPEGVYRTPSGGVERGEDFARGAAREALEETGLIVELERYILRIRAILTQGAQRTSWTTHVFSARARGGEPIPKDTREIAEARFATIEELRGPLHRALMASGSGGLAYRAALTQAALDEMERLGLIEP
ncbi:MAG: NUDIX domain-containing protein [Nitrospinota bacterium]